jgi:hypothetical protein
MGMRKIKRLCDEAGVKVTYERIPYDTKVTFHRNDHISMSRRHPPTNGDAATTRRQTATPPTTAENGLEIADIRILILGGRHRK